MDNLEPIARAAIRRIDAEYGPWWAAVALHAIAEAQQSSDVINPLEFITEQVRIMERAYGERRRDHG